MSLQTLQADLGGREGTPQTLIRNKTVTSSSSDLEGKLTLGRQAACQVGAREKTEQENSDETLVEMFIPAFLKQILFTIRRGKEVSLETSRYEFSILD